jgi:hypothetical protein
MLRLILSCDASLLEFDNLLFRGDFCRGCHMGSAALIAAGVA